MDVKIDSRLLVAERKKRAWSQQHLADAAGLALRTIQRIEAHGTGSYESTKAIASCLGVSVGELASSEVARTTGFINSRNAKAAGAAIGGSVLAGVAALFVGNVFAQQVQLDVDVTEEEYLGESEEEGVNLRNFKSLLLLDNGEAKDLPLEGEFNLVISPRIVEGERVVLSVQFYQFEEHGFELVGEPRVVTANGDEIELEFEIREFPRHAYRVAVTPSIR